MATEVIEHNLIGSVQYWRRPQRRPRFFCMDKPNLDTAFEKSGKYGKKRLG